MRLVFKVVEEKISSGDVVVVEEERGKIEGYFARSRGRKNIELRDENPLHRKGAKIRTIKREKCKKVRLGFEKEGSEEFIEMMGDITSSLIKDKVFWEWKEEKIEREEDRKKERSVIFNKVSVY